ncbi:MAG: hypothetical protein ACREUU_16655, partial [Gammaproteobacteria bacterium]
VSSSSGRAGERSTLWTIDGTAETGLRVDGLRWIVPVRFLRHSSHSPETPGVPPQAQARCKTLIAVVFGRVVYNCVCVTAR